MPVALRIYHYTFMKTDTDSCLCSLMCNWGERWMSSSGGSLVGIRSQQTSGNVLWQSSLRKCTKTIFPCSNDCYSQMGYGSYGICYSKYNNDWTGTDRNHKSAKGRFSAALLLILVLVDLKWKLRAWENSHSVSIILWDNFTLCDELLTDFMVYIDVIHIEPQLTGFVFQNKTVWNIKRYLHTTTPENTCHMTTHIHWASSWNAEFNCTRVVRIYFP